MNHTTHRTLAIFASACPAIGRAGLAALLLAGVAQAPLARADDDGFRPGNLLVSRVVYDNNPNNVTAGVTQLPPNCVAPNCVTAVANGSYPQVFNNDTVDASFGITAKIVLDQMTRWGELVSSLEVPNSL